MAFTSRSRSESIARQVIALEPGYADQQSTLVALFDGDTPPQSLPNAFVATRRRQTEASWSKGVVEWNARAAERLDLMRQAGSEAGLVAAFQEVFAADFDGRAFSRDLDVAGATFPGHVLLNSVTVGGSLRLDGIKAIAEIRATNLRVARDATCEQSLFVGPVRFDGSQFLGAARFSFSSFSSDVSLDKVAVEREFWLRHASFSGSVQMRFARMSRDVSLGAHYSGPVAFIGTRFEDTVSFENAEFDDDVDLTGCRFGGLVILNALKLSRSIFLDGARFSGPVRPSLDLLTQASDRRSDRSGLRS